jgi:hypothetical protein
MLAHVVVAAAPAKHLHKQAPEQLEPALPVEPLPPSAVSPVEGETRQQYRAHQEEKREHQKEVKLQREAAAIKAKMAKMLDSYGEAATTTAGGI